ncbi:MAG: hypothetical protein NC081_02235 [Roseburia sp.]|nr:hypothetical protein [Roseburia sp.]
MKRTLCFTSLFILLIACILTHSSLSLYYALNGLELWYRKMIPALLPFMILSGIMIRMHLTEQFSRLLYPVLGRLYRISRNGCYALFMGFFCGFPMGAKTIQELYTRKRLSFREACFLLSFCNNIGPVYFCSFVLPLLGRKLIFPYLLGMYGIPLLYGLTLRYTCFRDISEADRVGSKASCPETTDDKMKLLDAVDSAVHSSVQSMLILGGYMILFNLLNILPHLFLGKPAIFIAPLLEITGGLSILKHRLPLYSLLLLSFGGFSCIAQTYSCLKGSELCDYLNPYVLHKLLLCLFTLLYYLLWGVLSPESFLR